jgi:hypothetical protein
MAKGGPTRSVAPLPAGGGRPGKAVDQDDDAYDDGSRKKAANADSDLPIGDLESLTLGEYSRWVVTEYNWDVAEACREQHMEGEQMRKARDDRHRERGQIRQQDTVEQMKEAKTRVDAHRRANTEQGSNVKRDVIAWKEATNELKAEWAKFGASVRAAQQAVSSTEIRDALQASKKEKCRQVKQEETGLTAAYERLRGEILAKNKDLVGRVKKETADVVTAQHHARPARTRAHARAHATQARPPASLRPVHTGTDWRLMGADGPLIDLLCVGHDCSLIGTDECVNERVTKCGR